jgi:hypothetical protein
MADRDTGTQDHLEGTGDQVKGRAEQALGGLTGDRTQQGEGLCGGFAVGGVSVGGKTMGSEVVVAGDAIVGGAVVVAVDYGVAQELANLIGADCKSKYCSAPDNVVVDAQSYVPVLWPGS